MPKFPYPLLSHAARVLRSSHMERAKKKGSLQTSLQSKLVRTVVDSGYEQHPSGAGRVIDRGRGSTMVVGDGACGAAQSAFAFSAPVYAALLGPASESGLELTVGLSYLSREHAFIYVYVCTRGPCSCAVASRLVCYTAGIG